MADEGETTSKLPRWLLLGGGVVMTALLVAAAVWHRNPEGSLPESGPLTPSTLSSSVADANNPTNDPPAPPELVAVLAGLKVGSLVDGWRIMAITVTSKPEVRGALTLLLRKGDKAFSIWILPKGQLKTPAPTETAGHSIFSGAFANADWIAAKEALDEIAERVRSSEGEPPPRAPAESP